MRNETLAERVADTGRDVKDFLISAVGVLTWAAILTSPITCLYRRELDDAIIHRQRPYVSVERDQLSKGVSYLTADFESRVSNTRLSKVTLHCDDKILFEDDKLSGDKVRLFIDLKHRYYKNHSFHKYKLLIEDEKGNIATRTWRNTPGYIWACDIGLKEEYVHVPPLNDEGDKGD